MNEEAIFTAALEKNSRAERATFLRKVCGSDDRLRLKIEELLAAHETPDSLLDEVPPSDSPSVILEAPGSVVGHYIIHRQIGEGGFGVVFEAEQRRPVNRRVALKVIKPGMDSRQVVGRFEVEREALSMMEHPNIARILDAGTTETGRPFFVMELVDGIPITRFCDAQRLTIRERLMLFISICWAIQHAHQKGIIHRDIKPSNLLISQIDGDAVPKVIDFGVAKAIHQRLTDNSVFTQLGQVVGTPEYMSPEQSELNQRNVDTRSDIYSLGAVLYELLTGTSPIPKDQLHSADFGELLHLIRQDAPKRPSDQLSSNDDRPIVSYQRRIDRARLTRQLRGELDWIVMKALEKDRSRRYQTAADLARDIERHLNNDSVLARPPSAFYRFSKFASKHKQLFAASILFMLALCVATLASLLFASNSRITELAAKASESRIRRESHARLNDIIELNVNAAASSMTDGENQIAAIFAAEALRLSVDEAKAERLHRMRCASAIQACAKPIRVWSTKLVRKSGPQEPWTHGMVLSRDGRFAATFNLHPLYEDSLPGAARIWDIESGSLLATLPHDNEVYDVAFSPNGKFIATASGDRSAQLWDLTSGKRVGSPLKHELSVTRVAFDHSGDRLVTATGLHTSDGREHDRRSKSSANVWSVPGGQLMFTLRHRTYVRDAIFSPDDHSIATASEDGTAGIWDATTGQRRLGSLAHGMAGDGPAMVTTIRFTADGSHLISGNSGTFPFRTRIWNIQKGTQTIKAVDGQFHDLSSDEGLLLTANGDDVFLWRIGERGLSPEPLQSSHLHLGRFSPCGRFVMTNSNNKPESLEIWDTTTRKRHLVLPHSGRIWSAEFLPEGHRIISLDAAGLIRVWDLVAAELPVRLVRTQIGQLDHASFGSSGRIVSQTSRQGETVLYDLISGNEICRLPGSRGDKTTFSKDENRLLVYGDQARLFDVRSTEPKMCLLAFPEDPPSRVTHASLSPDAKFAVTGHVSGQAFLWDAQNGAPIASTSKGGSVSRVAFSDQGDSLVICTGYDPRSLLGAHDKGFAQVMRVPSGRPMTSNLQHAAPITCVDFSPDGSRIVTGCRSLDPTLCTVQVWRIADENRLAFVHHQADILQAEFLDNDRIVTLSRDGTSRIWNATTGDPIGAPMTHDGTFDSRFVVQNDLLLISNSRRSQVFELASGKPVTTELSISTQSAFLSPDENSIFVSDSGAIRILPLVLDPRPISDIVATAQILSDSKIVSNTRVELTADEYLAIWDDTANRYFDLLRSSKQQLAQWNDRRIEWHLDRARTEKRNQNWERTVFHLDRAIPDLDQARGRTKAEALVDRADAFASRSQWQRAERDIEQAATYSNDPQVAYRLAQLHLRAGRLTEHAKVCAGMRDAYDQTGDAETRRWLAETCVFIASADDDWRAFSETFEEGSSWYEDLLMAAVFYRAGLYEKSDELFENHPNYLMARDYFFLAMVKYRLGDKRNAEATLGRANRLYDDAQRRKWKYWFGSIGISLLGREANQLIGGN